VAGPILFLGREDSPILAHLREAEPDVRVLGADEPLELPALEEMAPDLLVSHGYRRIIRPPVLERFPDRVVNLHISLLPYNRGTDPNLWSVLEDTPAGVSVHFVDEGVDTGDVIAQREVALADDETLATSYARLQEEMAALFRETWPAIRAGTAGRRPQTGPATVHRAADRTAVEHLLTRGWDTPLGELRGRLRLDPGLLSAPSARRPR
jgi:methionyl-tRNA formyltransferase